MAKTYEEFHDDSKASYEEEIFKAQADTLTILVRGLHRQQWTLNQHGERIEEIEDSIATLDEKAYNLQQVINFKLETMERLWELLHIRVTKLEQDARQEPIVRAEQLEQTSEEEKTEKPVYYLAEEYCELKSIPLVGHVEVSIGKRAAKLCREYKVNPLVDIRKGNGNKYLYPEYILDVAVESLRKEGNI
jgi:hypothetical protein